MYVYLITYLSYFIYRTLLFCSYTIYGYPTIIYHITWYIDTIVYYTIIYPNYLILNYTILFILDTLFLIISYYPILS